MMKAYLQRLNPETAAVWYYSMQLQRDLLGRWHLIKEWGRSGSPGTLRRTPYDTLDEATAAFSNLRQELTDRGYRVVMQEGLKPALTACLSPDPFEIDGP
ncbi:MAG: WGR domain-containing protein [Magnetococcales bacterium]|nr:WGR domain-containing protein [Magnetococcales bacterium]